MDEIKEHYQEVSKAHVNEIAGLYGLGCFQRWPRHRPNDIIDARWVITRKVIEGTVGVHRRFAVSCFTDTFQDLGAYAGAISRSSQRFANAVAAGNFDFMLFSFDVSQFFANGMAFEQSSELTCADIREVQSDVPTADLECLRQINGFEAINPIVETLVMLKPVYGLNVVPRAWRKKFHHVLIQWVSCQQSFSEPEL